MFEKLGTPRFLREARRQGPRTRVFSPTVTLLLFLLVYFLASQAQSLLLLPVLMVLVMGDQRFWTLMSSPEVSEQNYDALLAYTEELLLHPAVTVATLFATAALIAGAFIFCRGIERRSFASMGFERRGAVRSLLSGTLVSLLLLLVAVGFAFAFGALRILPVSTGSAPLLVLLVLGFLVQGFAEEIFFRGYLLPSLGRVMKLPHAMVISAFAFTAMHGANAAASPLALLNLFLFGVFSALYMIRGANMLALGMLHAVWNIVQGVLLGAPVSGLPMPATALSLSLTENASLLHGGDFGLEGGIAVTLALTLGITLLAMKKSKDAEEPSLHGGQGE